MMLLLPASIFVSTLVFILSLLPSVSALCLPCHAAFRRPDFLQRWTLDSRDSGAAPTIPILNPSYRSVWLNGELQLVTWNTTGVNPRPNASECQVYLGQWDWSTRDYRKVFFDYPLAANCSLRDGNTTVRVPKDDKFRSGNNWVIVLFTLNSEGHSAPFTIAAPPKDQ